MSGDATGKLRYAKRLTPPRHPAVAWTAVFLLIALATWAGLASVSHPQCIAPFWWPNALLAAVLLLNRRPRWAGYLSAGFAGIFVVHLLFHDSLPHSLISCTADTAEAALTAWMVYRILGDSRELQNSITMFHLIALLVAGVCLPAAVSGLSIAVALHLLSGVPVVLFLERWFPPNALGIAVVTPLVLALFRGGAADLFRRERLRRTLAFLLLLAAVSCAVFSRESLPLAFLIFPPLLMAVVELGFAGGAIGVCIMAAVAMVFTSRSHGPLTLIHEAAWQHRIVTLQLLFATAILSVAVLAMVLAERRRLERLALESEQRYRMLAEHSRDIIILGLLDGTRKYVSPASREVLGWSPEEMLGNTFVDLAHPDDLAAIHEQMRLLAEGEDTNGVTYRMRTKDGGYKWLESNLRPYPDPLTGEIIGFVNVARDIQKRKTDEETLQKAYHTLEALATVDGLTGIANRRRFGDVLNQEWRRAGRAGLPISLVLLDVDYFKSYNDLYGHVRGDSCLKQIAEAAQDVIGRPADVVARFGGEEFAIVLPNTESCGAADIAEQLRQAVEHRALKHEKNPPGVVTISAGYATLIPAHGSKATVLIEAADSALYKAKRNGRNRVEFASHAMGAQPVAV